jgi:hypothetical protein
MGKIIRITKQERKTFVELSKKGYNIKKINKKTNRCYNSIKKFLLIDLPNYKIYQKKEKKLEYKKTREKKVKHAIYNYFTKKYCKFGNYNIRQKTLFDAFQQYIKSRNLLIYQNGKILQITQRSFNHQLLRLMKIEYIHAQNIKKFRGITLNEKGLNLLFPKKMTLKENIDSKKACIIMSCSSTVMKFEEIYNSWNESIQDTIDKDSIIHNIKKIEKLMYRKNIYRLIHTKIGLALWITTKYSQDFVCEELLNKRLSPPSIRNLFHDLRLEPSKIKNEQFLNKIKGNITFFKNIKFENNEDQYHK